MLNLQSRIDDFEFRFRETLEEEKFRIVQDKNIFTFPVEVKTSSEGRMNFQKLASEIQRQINQEPSPTWKNVLPHISIRKTSDLDYRIDSDQVPSEILGFMRDQLSTLLLNLRSLHKARIKLLEILGGLSKLELAFRPSLNSPDVKLAAVFQEAFSSNGQAPEELETKVNEVLEDKDSIVRANEQIVLRAEKLRQN